MQLQMMILILPDSPFVKVINLLVVFLVPIFTFIRGLRTLCYPSFFLLSHFDQAISFTERFKTVIIERALKNSVNSRRDYVIVDSPKNENHSSNNFWFLLFFNVDKLLLRSNFSDSLFSLSFGKSPYNLVEIFCLHEQNQNT